MKKIKVVHVERLRTMSTLDRICSYCEKLYEIINENGIQYCPHCGYPGRINGTEHYPGRTRK